MKSLTKIQRKQLKTLAHSHKPLIQIGKKGLTDSTISNIDQALNDHELIRIRYLQNKSQTKTLTDALAQKTRSHIVDLIGHTAILYRPNQDLKKRK